MAKTNKQYFHGLRLGFSFVVVFLVMFAAMPGVMSQKARNGQEVPGKPETYCDGGCDKCIWTIATEDLASRSFYTDPLTEEIIGFNADVVNAVCRIAGKTCELVFDIPPNCWTNVPGEVQRGGPGLLNGYYDACAGWYPTKTRSRTFKFSDSFGKIRNSGFFVTAENRDTFNWQDLTGKTIGFIDYFQASPSCLLAEADQITGADLPVESIVFYADREQLIAGVLAGEVDAAFDRIKHYKNRDDLELASDEIECTLGANSMMMRKDSCLDQWFNPALEQLLASDEYQDICNDLQAVHGDLPGPDAEEVCIGF